MVYGSRKLWTGNRWTESTCLLSCGAPSELQQQYVSEKLNHKLAKRRVTARADLELVKFWIEVEVIMSSGFSPPESVTVS